MAFNGPAGFLTVGTQLPNISGQNVTEFFYSYFFCPSITFTSTGTTAALSNAPTKSDQRWKVPLALTNFYNTIPASVKKKIGISLLKN